MKISGRLLKICEILVNKQYFGGNKYFYVTFDTDTEKIRGAFSDKMISEAIDEYIALNHTRLIKPLVNQIDAKGKKKYNTATATKQVKASLRQMYVS